MGDISLLKEDIAKRDQEIARLRQNDAQYMRKDAVLEWQVWKALWPWRSGKRGDISLLKGELDQTNQALDRLSQEITRLKQHEALHIRKDALGEVPSMKSFLAMEARQEGDISFVKKELLKRARRSLG
jgi:hypothetical protein